MNPFVLTRKHPSTGALEETTTTMTASSSPQPNRRASILSSDGSTSSSNAAVAAVAPTETSSPRRGHFLRINNNHNHNHSHHGEYPSLLPGVSLEEGDLPMPMMMMNRTTDRSPGMVSSPLPQPARRSITDEGITMTGTQPHRPFRRTSLHHHHHPSLLSSSRIYDDPMITEGYASIPFLEVDELPRGGVSIDTAAVGRIQFGIPPETIKDSMRLGYPVPRVYIVPTERFCNDWGPALGVNLAEFEFPAYFNWFVRQTKCCLIVDSIEAERHIRSVFEETLLGPKQFRDTEHPCANRDEDFDPDYPIDDRPNFYKEFQFFRKAEKTDQYPELTTDMLLDFYHFDKTGKTKNASERGVSTATPNDNIGVPPMPPDLPQEINLLEETTTTTTTPSGGEHTPLSWALSTFHKSLNNLDLSERSSSHGGTGMYFEHPKRTRFASHTAGSGGGEFGYHHQHHQHTKASRRASLESVESSFSQNTCESIKSEITGVEKSWMYSQIQWLGELVTIWPMDATPEQIEQRTVPRVEIFKMPGSGTEYVFHDVDENNIIIGKARILGTVRVPDEIRIEGFQTTDGPFEDFDDGHPSLLSPTSINHHHHNNDDHSLSSMGGSVREASIQQVPPKAVFHPPSFGVTVLGNSHGFDKNGSTSGYVLWINGRGIMIDPPPYSSATLEREGIRPQMIFGVMITHCHADHDAGAFQKVLTGSKLTLITTPSIYTSFIRKYSALSGLSPSLLQHSHRYRRAIIGQPLNFQGATFHFTYSLHTIPCMSFKVEWRDRSMVFTGDHLNLPPLLEELKQKGVLSEARYNSLTQMPLQECDALLHEAGAPPIHTPIHVLQNLPEEVKARLYVVHTAALPPDCGLRVAPVGTAGTIRLDEVPNGNRGGENSSHEQHVPEVLNRPPCISDSWFILNLISNIPFFGTLSYANTMEVLEVANVEVFKAGDVVVPGRKRTEVLCVIWEGSCIEKRPPSRFESSTSATVWHAGDWTGPTSLQPNPEKAARPVGKKPLGDIIALSSQGVKVILLLMSDLDTILTRGSALYRKYKEQEAQQSFTDLSVSGAPAQHIPLNVADSLKANPLLGSLFAHQIRSLESIAEGPRKFNPGSYLWIAGDPCDYAFLLESGTASFGHAPNCVRTVTMRRSRQASMSNLMETDDGRVLEVDKLIKDMPPESDFARLELFMSLRAERIELDPDYRPSDPKRRNTHRNLNKVLARLYASRKVIDGLILSRGCFLSDTSRMVSGNLVSEWSGSSSSKHLHTSTIVAGSSGCVAWVFPRTALLPFLEANPGVLLCLLGTQVIV